MAGKRKKGERERKRRREKEKVIEKLSKPSDISDQFFPFYLSLSFNYHIFIIGSIQFHFRPFTRILVVAQACNS